MILILDCITKINRSCFYRKATVAVIPLATITTSEITSNCVEIETQPVHLVA